MKTFRPVMWTLAGLIGLLVLLQLPHAVAQEATLRDQAAGQKKNGNWKDAYATYAALALDANTAADKVVEDYTNALECMNRLGNIDTLDEFREKVVAAHPKHWRLLFAVAQSYMNGQHHGYIVADKFSRGWHRGGGRYVNTYQRDRVRALQLIQQAEPLATADPDTAAVGQFYLTLANFFIGERGGNNAWALQTLTDIATLPDYDDGNYYGGWRGAPVGDDGNPVYFRVPKSWGAATNDGQRWRWALARAAEVHPALAAQTAWTLANFLHAQFGVQTMANYGFRYTADDDKDNETGPYAVQTLKDDETIARLATGIKRFSLPTEFSYLRILQGLADGNSGYRHSACSMLAQIYEDRRQYARAVEYWKRVNNTERVNQIVGNWGTFEPIATQPAGGDGATVDYRFRNGKALHLTAQAIKVDKLLEDVQAFIKSNPKDTNSWWQRADINNIGYRLVQQNEAQYLGDTVAEWDETLSPRANHFDARTVLHTPLKKAGAYLLVAQMQGGNTSRIILWVQDTVIVRKPLDGAAFYFVADAVTGKPLPNLTMNFFGYRQDWRENAGKGTYVFTTKSFTKATDADGQVLTTGGDMDTNYTWLATAKDGNRLAYLGFSGVWFGGYNDPRYEGVKTFVITDRPIYRPDQAVHFKFWVSQTRYDMEGNSPYAGRQFAVQIHNPKGEKVYEGQFTADAYGGLNGDYTLPKDATLGQYGINLASEPWGGSSFRVEEYKKPEFEVSVEAPKEPVMLGEGITATVKAKYYFGAPVTNATVKYKVLRTSYNARWYPNGKWDWFYGRGYWWYAYDYAWYPGWREWGCMRPVPIWWGGYRPAAQPEVVMESEAPIGEDGTVKIAIDTTFAKEMFGDTDHRYEISAEVTDQSRRTITGGGQVLVARKPFKVYAWVDRGHYRAGDTVQADFSAQTLDNRPVQGPGLLRLLEVTYGRDEHGALKPTEKEVERWNLNTNDQGTAHLQLKAAKPGQYRLSYTVRDIKNHTLEGGYVFDVVGEGFDGAQYRFNDLELITDQREYQPGDTARVLVNTNREDSTVLLFARPANGIYQKPRLLRLDGKSVVEALQIAKADMPNFFLEAVTVADGKVYTESREVVVPPESRVLDINITAPEKTKPGQKTAVKVAVTDADGKPFQGSLVLSMYDKSVEYISGGSNVPEIKAFFWKWRRGHYARTEHSLQRYESPIFKPYERMMATIGVFGDMMLDDDDVDANGTVEKRKDESRLRSFGMENQRLNKSALPMAAPGVAGGRGGEVLESAALADAKADAAGAPADGEGGGAPDVQPTVRSNFADTALWIGALTTDAKGQASVDVTMPENLTTWKTKVWAIGKGAAVGESDVEVTTTKNLIVRLQAPRFFTQNDEVVLSANVHNFLPTAKPVKVVLELDGGCLTPRDAAKVGDSPYKLAVAPKLVTIAANGEQRVDWRVKVTEPGLATVRMKALTDEESDAMQMTFPVNVHGMLKTESGSGALKPDQTQGSLVFTVPKARRPEQSRLEVRYSPTLAGAMVDALPYMTAYPYQNTEATLNRFLPTVVTQNVLKRMGVDLKALKEKTTNLNAQEIGDDKARMADWKRHRMAYEYIDRNPVYDDAVVQAQTLANIQHLAAMQVGDGGWGWFSGYGERSWPHTTALVVHGLQLAKENGIALPQNMLERGVQWLTNYQAEQVRRLKLPTTDMWHKHRADEMDAYTYMVLADAKVDNVEMRDFLYRDRINLSVYAKAIFGLALHTVGDKEKCAMLVKNVEQYLQTDAENQTAYLKLPGDGWWYWYGNDIEADAYYLKLLVATDPKSDKAAWVVKYLLNNRRHATYWNSTRDTAIVVEAFADYLKATGEAEPNMTVGVFLDGKKVKEVKIDKTNLFSFDNKLVLEGTQVTTGKHTLTLMKTGKGPLYFNVYLTNFTLEEHITKAGVEVKVNRKYYKLEKVDKSVNVEGSRGQAVAQKVEKYVRKPLAEGDTLKSGDLVEVELEIDSKNDYEYLMFEDMKAAGFEPVSLRSGYGGNEMGAYMELRDERVCFFVRSLARGKHSVSYRLRAEIPGTFNALPTKATGVYAPELKANSDEIKLNIEDK
jgi:uncharacterized protein YfaS (alpha-2-macroglobulin family)